MTKQEYEDLSMMLGELLLGWYSIVRQVEAGEVTPKEANAWLKEDVSGIEAYIDRSVEGDE